MEGSRNLKLYHGTMSRFTRINLSYAKELKDFGKGFYLTSDYNQAKDFALSMKIKSARRYNMRQAYVYMVTIEKEKLKTLDSHAFQGTSLAWVDYILFNRGSNILTSDLIELGSKDLIIGKVADARAQFVIDDFLRLGDFSKQAKMRLIANLHAERLADQYCFKTEKAVDLLNRSRLSVREV